MPWIAQTDTLECGCVRRVRVLCNGELISYADAIERWKCDGAFRAFFIGVLANAPFDAYFWETPPVTRATSAQPFEFVLVESPDLVRVDSDPDAFADHFEAADQEQDVAVFSNFSGDALLVAPCPRVQLSAYAHLAAFVRMAPAAQQHAFWRTIGISVADHLTDHLLWLSTSGLGVAWLHARLDSWPKYYTFRSYRQPGKR